MPAQLLPDATRAPIDRPMADCRIYERAACSVPATCQPASALEMKEMRWAATITDISQGGVRLILQRRFEKGAGLAVELPGDEQREPCVVFVKVVHLQSQNNGTWALGCKFISELSEDEMQRLLTSTNHLLSAPKQEYLEEKNDDPEDAHQPPSSAKAAVAQVRFLTAVHLLVETQTGSIVDCVIRRLNVTKCWPLTAGKILSLNGKTSDHAPWSLRIQVTECTAQAKGWEIHGRIVGPSSANDIFKALGDSARS